MMRFVVFRRQCRLEAACCWALTIHGPNICSVRYCGWVYHYSVKFS